MIQYLKNDSISCLHTALVAKSRGGTLKGRTDSALEIYQETLEKAEEKDRIKSDETEKEEPRENRGKQTEEGESFQVLSSSPCQSLPGL